MYLDELIEMWLQYLAFVFLTGGLWSLVAGSFAGFLIMTPAYVFFGLVVGIITGLTLWEGIRK